LLYLSIMFDIFFQNIEISILSILLSISLILFFKIKHEYIHKKILWWIYIISFIIFIFLNNFTLIIWLIFLNILILSEFIKVLKFSFRDNLLYWLLFLHLLVWFNLMLYNYTSYFFYWFIIISISDIIAYFVWKWIPWKKWFTSLSPNKSLSWVLWQSGFIFLTFLIILSVLWLFSIQNILISIWISLLAPIWDLTESFFKRNSNIKDMAEYIPWHWWILDRIDSIFLSSWILWLAIYYFPMV